MFSVQHYQRTIPSAQELCTALLPTPQETAFEQAMLDSKQHIEIIFFICLRLGGAIATKQYVPHCMNAKGERSSQLYTCSHVQMQIKCLLDND
jgi:hypothetical protein